MKAKHLLSILTACTLMAASVPVSPVNAVGNISISAEKENMVGIGTTAFPIIKHVDEASSGTNYYVWKADDDDGKLSFSLYSNKSFQCSWEDTDLVYFEAGDSDEVDITKKKSHYLDYSVYTEADDYILSARFECRDSKYGFIEVYVDDFCTNKDIYDEMEKKSTINIDGVDFDVYFKTPEEGMSIDYQVHVVRSENYDAKLTHSSKINLKAVCEKLGCKTISYTMFSIHGLSSNGNAFVEKNKIISEDYPESINVPNYDKTQENVYYDGLQYSFWQREEYSDGKMSVTGNGDAECSFDNNEIYSSCLFKKGIVDTNGLPIDEYNKISVDYYTDINTNANHYAGVYGWFTDPNVEFYIVQFKDTEFSLGDAEPIKTVEIDGVKYDIYKFNRASFDAPPMIQYWSVSQLNFEDDVYGANGSVDLLKHFKEWEKAGLKTGRFYEASSFAETSGKGNGKFTLGKTNVTIESKNDKDDVVFTDDGSKHYSKDDYNYYYEKYNGQFTLKSDGTLIADYPTNVSDPFYIGKQKDIRTEGLDLLNGDNIKMSYNANVSAGSNYYIGGIIAYLHEKPYKQNFLYVLDNVGDKFVPGNAKKIGEAEVDGKTYELYARPNAAVIESIIGNSNIDEYYSICKEPKNYTQVTGEIDIAAHAKLFADAGYDLGDPTLASLEISIFGDAQGKIIMDKSEITLSKNKETIAVPPGSDNTDKSFTNEDVELFKSFLLGQECDLSDKDFDLNDDGVWDSFDLIAMKKAVKN